MPFCAGPFHEEVTGRFTLPDYKTLLYANASSSRGARGLRRHQTELDLFYTSEFAIVDLLFYYLFRAGKQTIKVSKDCLSSAPNLNLRPLLEQVFFAIMSYIPASFLELASWCELIENAAALHISFALFILVRDIQRSIRLL